MADTDEEAWELAVNGPMGRMMREYFLPLLANFGFLEYLKHDPDLPDSEITVEYCAKHNWLVGSPDTVAEKLAGVYDECGGFGKLLVFGFDYSEQPQQWRHSMQVAGRGGRTQGPVAGPCGRRRLNRGSARVGGGGVVDPIAELSMVRDTGAMPDKPSYLGLLNAIANAESDAEGYLGAWADVTERDDVRQIIATVALRGGRARQSLCQAHV